MIQTVLQLFLIASLMGLLFLSWRKDLFTLLQKRPRFRKFVNYGGVQYILSIYILLFGVAEGGMHWLSWLIIVLNTGLGLYLTQAQYFREDKIFGWDIVAVEKNYD